MKNVTLGDYIISFDNTLTKEFCEGVCEKMKNDTRRSIGIVGRDKTLNLEIKNSYDLHISPLEDWREEDDIFFTTLASFKDKYMDTVQENTGLTPDFFANTGYGYASNGDVFADTGYQIKMYEPGQRYNWHHDYIIDAKEGPRVLTYIWYLNDDFEGGETEFIDGTVIKPERGKMLFFPSTWMYVHRGKLVTKGNKYIATGWFYHQHPLTNSMFEDK